MVRSLDGGATWEPVAACLPRNANAVYRIALTPSNVFIVVPVRSADSPHGEVFQLDLCPTAIAQHSEDSFSKNGSLLSSGMQPNNGNFTVKEERTLLKPDIQVTPNPASEDVQIEISTTEYANINIKFLDMRGRTVMLIPKGALMQGRHSFSVNISPLASGQYICVAEIGHKRVYKIVSVFK